MSRRRAEAREADFDERITALIQAAYSDPRSDLARLGRMAYELFTTVEPPAPMISNLRPNLFVTYDRARTLDAIVQRSLSPDPATRFTNARAFADALSSAFGPKLVELPVASDELILLGCRVAAPYPAVIATDGVHAIDLLIDDPDRRLVLAAGWETNDLLDALRDCVLRRMPIVIDGDCARFPHPLMVQNRPPNERDVEALRELSPETELAV
jgi:hypothetical protein